MKWTDIVVNSIVINKKQDSNVIGEKRNTIDVIIHCITTSANSTPAVGSFDYNFVNIWIEKEEMKRMLLIQNVNNNVEVDSRKQ